METTEKFDEWAVVEVMGHSRYAGRVSEQALGGANFVRVDVPSVDERPAFTKILGAGSIFCLTPCSEEVAKEAARQFRSSPLAVVHMPSTTRALEFDDDDDGWHG